VQAEQKQRQAYNFGTLLATQQPTLASRDDQHGLSREPWQCRKLTPTPPPLKTDTKQKKWNKRQ